MNHHFHAAAIWIAITLAGNTLAGEVRTNWVTSWYAASQPGWDNTFVLPMNAPAFLEDETSCRYPNDLPWAHH